MQMGVNHLKRYYANEFSLIANLQFIYNVNIQWIPILYSNANDLWKLKITLLCNSNIN